ncbi:hypothetical protein CAPTEDRAFT_187847 [Capitella teleta]|uniref:Activin types I and II receptor domain-containing protein n=1 Tax=Capitella teleta TaxID=283909 RepID=R7TUX5_CAPTE|nr:hypothetical protein CAPTEDRAFT_187847 [Capitella teleta]|eukprot:ELT97713.1 hypothetical protein CAPTEDRAFT_187847 [Capitella teleta]
MAGTQYIDPLHKLLWLLWLRTCARLFKKSDYRFVSFYGLTSANCEITTHNCAEVVVHIILNVLIYFDIICVCSGDLQCYVGQTKSNNPTAVLNKVVCSERHHSEMNLTVTPMDNMTTTNNDYSTDSAELSGFEAKNCAIFARNDSVIDFVCDHDHLCDDASGEKYFFNYHFTHKGSSGALFCCQDDLCNYEGRLTSASQPTCNEGTQSEGKDSIAPTQCELNICLTTAYFSPDGFITERVYHCDSKHVCLPNITDDPCHNVTRDDLTYSTCCCSGSNCNVLQPSIFPRDHMTSPSASGKSKKPWVMTGGIVASAMLAVLLFLTLALAIRKYRQHRAEHLSFTYTQLTADLAEPEMDPLVVTDDDRMIIG